MTEKQLRQKFVGIAQAYIGCKEGSAGHRRIIDTYNTLMPLPRGYKMTYTAPWCAPFVTAIAIMTELESIMPLECSCTKQIKQLKAKGRWVEDDAYVPQTGDLIYYMWADDGVGDADGDVDHVGIVANCDGKTVKVIEGNKNNAVSYRTINVNGRYIRGYGTPDYASLAEKEDKMIIKTIDDVPDKLKAEVTELLMCGAINGGTPENENSEDINMEYEALRAVIIAKRYIDKACEALVEDLVNAVKSLMEES